MASVASRIQVLSWFALRDGLVLSKICFNSLRLAGKEGGGLEGLKENLLRRARCLSSQSWKIWKNWRGHISEVEMLGALTGVETGESGPSC